MLFLNVTELELLGGQDQKKEPSEKLKEGKKKLEKIGFGEDNEDMF